MGTNISETVCVMPWVGVHIDSLGDMHPCCRAQRGEHTLRRDSKKNFNLVDDNISDYLNSSSVQALRKQLINGERPEICKDCWFDEKIGKHSFRKVCNNLHQETYKLIHKSQTTISPGLENLDLQVGNKCNQRCRMCDPYSSSGLAKDQKDINNYTKEQISFFTNSEEFRWPQNEINWQYLKKNSSNLKFIKLWGGEAFLEKSTIAFLEFLIDKDLNNTIELFINTNGHAINTNFLNLFNQFKLTNLMISIDGVAEVNEYIRYPSKWGKTVSEFDHFIQWSLNLQDCRVKLSFNSVFQLLNLFNIPQMIDFLITKFKPLDYIPEIHVNFLSQPFYLSSQVAPIELKKKAIKIYEKLLDSDILVDNNEALKQNISAYINFINEKDNSHQYKKFLEVNSSYDLLRNQNLAKQIPEVITNV